MYETFIKGAIGGLTAIRTSTGPGMNRGRPRRRGRGPKPVKVGDVVEVEVTEISKRGDGVAKIRGFIIFIPNTKPGEKVRVKITRVGPSFAVAELAQEAGQGAATGQETQPEEASQGEEFEEE
ncbi:TRAM domain-containing protein [Caldivirga maquilingensis]|uniref:Deoxyribonuclease/rho motif-related TRAM n=1 Tax=Caldivirga maquilingensis (strain ATCC 700844 / DSM 13496 / JCM 10307 / IC-167) TaxID=397948 RepID=A8ME60_CALMQ|nr:deoxyribonuclease/rho motif-related TRAM [Caldivirga maquilingensis IC-167]